MTPTTNCTTLGYTQTSCPSGGVKCPWDTSKWHCDPCDSAYKYACTGTGYAGGSGTACGGKYTSCNCATGYFNKNGECVKNIETSGFCCDAECGDYDACMYAMKRDCDDVQGSCKSTGGIPRRLRCYYGNGFAAFYQGEYECVFSADYKYTCSGTGYSGGEGTAYNGKYKSCYCASGYVWKNGSCLKKMDPYSFNCCDTSCPSYYSCSQEGRFSGCSSMISTCQGQGGTAILKECYDEYGYISTYGASYKCEF